MHDILKNDGGAEALKARYEQVSAHNQNYRPLMWPIYRPYRAAIFQLSRLLKFHSATHNTSLIDALDYIQSYQHTKRNYLTYTISIDIASIRWQALIRSRQKLETVLDRRQLEVCVFHYLALGLQSGDVYVEGSQAYADYRQQLCHGLSVYRVYPPIARAADLRVPIFCGASQARLRK